MKNFLARLIGAYDNRRDRRAWQASTSEPDLIDGDTAAATPAGSDVYGACTVDDEPVPAPRRIDTLAIWSTADQNSIDAAFLIIADAAESAEFAAIIRRQHTDARKDIL
jgi:hypothetical protein